MAKIKLSNDVAETVSLAGARNRFNPAAMKIVTRIAILNSAVSMVLIASLAGIYAFRPQPQSYAVSPNGRVTALVPMSTDVGQEAVASFASQAIVASYSLDFLHWRTQLGELSPSYTADGYNGFMVAVEPLKDRVVEGRYITAVGITEPPVILKSGLISGVMKYRVSMDVMIGFESQVKRIDPQKWHVEAIIERVPFSVSPVGLQISSIVASQPTVQQ